MAPKIMAVAVGLALFAWCAPSASLALETHLSEAVSHTREAVVAGREHEPSALVRHATEALHHAEAAQRENPNRHVKAGIRRLKEAIKFGKKKRSAATTIADRALQELERAPH
ncbi:MAG: small metal-binding protein SmbP [Methylocystis sp.]|uniref:small metal-binding protein SmbP n=1 Tax=Methylocystis sp. TaxID=1911079 RepID=UPI003D0F0A52